MTFELLCAELGIDYKQDFSTKLKRLKKWFHDKLSSDLHFSGEENDQFEQYKELAELYFNFILPEVTQEIEKSNPKFKGESLVSALASMGFDRVLLSLKPNKAILNIKNLNGLTPLHLAALEGHVQTVQVILSLGAETEILNKQQQYPLFSALVLPILYDEVFKQNKIKIFNLLKAKNKQHLNHQDSAGNTILHQMALHNFDDLIKDILTTNMDLAYLQNHHTHYPVHTAILNNRIQSVILLLHVKDAAKLADSHGWVALHYAARYANDSVLVECIKSSTNLDIRDHQERTPLMLAAELGHLSVVQILIERGAKIDLRDMLGFTVLHYAVQSGNLELVGWLIDNTTIDINAKDNQNNTPLRISETASSETGSMEEISTFLLEHGAMVDSSLHCK